MPKRSLSFVSPYNKYIYLMGIESKTIQYLLDNDISIATAESCTGGLLAAKLTAQSGISQIYQSGFITYSNQAKIKHLKVSPLTLKKTWSRQPSSLCSNVF
jgi:PncC family amidohydrolase